jgi:hypothetical protein
MKLFIASIFITSVLAACDEDKLNDCIVELTQKQNADPCQTLKEGYQCYKKHKCLTDENCAALEEETIDNCKVKCGCFPATSTVELESGKHINMDQLQLGDKVRVGPAEFSEVYFFSTEMAETTSKFVKLVTKSGAVTMTQGHYLYVNGALKVASDVQVGDNIVLGNGTHVAVTEVSSLWAPGLYNPHTLHGDIVVDGIHTSTYTDAVHPTLAHALMSPLRTMYSAGISFGKEFRDTAKSMPSWLREAIQA